MCRGILLTVLALVSAGCGSSAAEPPAARPHPAPPPVEEPAGTVVPLAEDTSSELARSAPLAGGAATIELDPGRREVVLRDGDGAELGRARAGIGPAGVASDGERIAYVSDATLGAVLVFRAWPELELTRRVFVPGGPWGIAHDPVRSRLWVAVSGRNVLAELSAGGRPRPLEEFPSVRRPLTVDVDAATGLVRVRGEDAEQQLDPPS